MASGNKRKDLINQVPTIDEGYGDVGVDGKGLINQAQPEDKTYTATKGILHNGKTYIKGQSVEAITGTDLQRLIKLGAVVEVNDGFPRVS